MSTKEVAKSTCDQVQRKSDLVKIKDPESDPIENSSKRRKTPVGLWRDNDVGMAGKVLLEAIEHHYPNTFQGVQIRASPIWLTILKQFYSVIKSFMGTPVDALMEEQVNRLREDLKEFETFGFDLSWAHKRLDMVDMLKFGKEPLQKELMALEESLVPLKLRVEWRWKKIMEAYDQWREAQFEFNNAKDARDKIAQEMVKKFGGEYDQTTAKERGGRRLDEDGDKGKSGQHWWKGRKKERGDGGRIGVDWRSRR
ncbi:hypothetical protein L1887_19675 [Cichorium endivia]|nr:hypothetical protein L1887_19675 [Cichorium endivia]